MATAANASKLNSKRKLLDDSDADSDDGGAALDAGFKVDQEFARRLEHNKKREERQRCKLQYVELYGVTFGTIPNSFASGRKVQEPARRR
jgi:hypothetical protein